MPVTTAMTDAGPGAGEAGRMGECGSVKSQYVCDRDFRRVR